jgi:hypothetical protein
MREPSDVEPRLGLVMSSRQLLVAQVAVALCSGVIEQNLDDWEIYRVALGDEVDDLARRLCQARILDESAGASVTEAVDCNGHPIVAVSLELSEDEVWVLQVAVDRLRGILARTGEFDGALDEDLDRLAFALV